MKDSFDSEKIAGVIHDENSLISFFDEEVLKVIFSKNHSYIDSKSEVEKKEDNSLIVQEVIIFKLGGKEYAFNIEVVAEIIDIVQSTEVAFTDNKIDGIINIRGQIVTIISLFEKLNVDAKVNEDSKIIVCDINDSKIGFIVDSISDIMDIKSDEIKDQDDELFPNILHLDDGKRLVLFMDIENIVISEES